jgi:serine/threonine protein kinase
MVSGPLKPGFRLGKYEILAHIATGGMARVYKAEDTELRRVVAIKVLRSRLARRDRDLERFRREARHAARLNHLHIVTLFECGYAPEHNLYYLAMEFIDGVDLEEYVRRKGPLPPEEARRMLIQAVKALDHAFERGVIHRDIKPSNFLLAQTEGGVVVKMTDLGVALVESDDEFKVTSEGTTVGTVDYISPEQASDSRSADVRSDIYSLGCTAFHMLAGRAPFAEGGLGERVFKHIALAPPDVRQFNTAVSADFWAVLKRMLAKKPEDRYATPAELLQALQQIPAAIVDNTGNPVTTAPTTRRRKTDYVHTLPSVPVLPLPEPAPAPEPPPPPKPRSRPTPPAIDQPTPPPTQRPVAPPAGQARNLVTLEQARAAAAMHERAVQVIAEGGGDDYARELIGNCLKLDPFNLAYHKTLRDMIRKDSGGVIGRLVSSLNVLALKSKVRAARSNGEWPKVLEQGEDVLVRSPADVETHLWLAEAAEKLDLPDLSLWFLEQGHEQAPDSAELMRALARRYERGKDWLPAIALWEKLRKRDPEDDEARRKIDELTIEDHIARTNARR